MPGGLSRTRRPWVMEMGARDVNGQFTSRARRADLLVLPLLGGPDLGQEADRLPLGRGLYLQAVPALDREPDGVGLGPALAEHLFGRRLGRGQLLGVVPHDRDNPAERHLDV